MAETITTTVPTPFNVGFPMYTILISLQWKSLFSLLIKESFYSVSLLRTMASQMGGGGSSSGGSQHIEDNEGIENGGRSYHSYTPEQMQRLEGFYNECPLPDENQQRKLGVELGLEPREIEFWLQNKRIRIEAQKEQADNNGLQSENHSGIQCENTAIMEESINVICSSCGGSSSREKELKQNLVKLQQENTELKIENERICDILAKYMGRSVQGTTFNLQDPSRHSQRNGSPAFGVDSLNGNFNDDNVSLAYQMKTNAEIKKSLMAEIAARAMDELIKLLNVDQPLWIKSSEYDQYILDQDNYQEIVSQPFRLRYPKSRMESSKDSGVVALTARSLVDIYLTADKWAGIFPNFISKARTTLVLDAGLLSNRSGILQLVYQQMHVLTPLVQQREFYVLRYCQQIDTGIWVIVNVSCDCLSGSSHDFSTCCWMYPSGCMFEEMPNGHSKVTCIEHVEVDDSFKVHPIYDDLVKSTLGFGAKRWIMTLQKTIERYSFFVGPGRPGLEGGRSGMMVALAVRMVKSYCSIFTLLRSSDLNQFPVLINNDIHIAINKSSPCQPVGIVISAATSFWVPTSTQITFKYLSNHIMRPQWDVLCNGYPVHEVMQLSTGNHAANCISILQPIKSDGNILIFQESMVDKLESYLVYAPIDASVIHQSATGMDSTTIPILTSGFAVNSDGADQRAAAGPSCSTWVPKSGGSLITVAFQLLASNSSYVEDVGPDTILVAEAFVKRTIRMIKSSLFCCG